MRTVIVNLPTENAFKLIRDLELNKILSIVKDDDIYSYALPGDAISISNFKKWIESAENAPVVTLQNAKTKWQLKKHHIQKLIK